MGTRRKLKPEKSVTEQGFLEKPHKNSNIDDEVIDIDESVLHIERMHDSTDSSSIDSDDVPDLSDSDCDMY